MINNYSPHGRCMSSGGYLLHRFEAKYPLLTSDIEANSCFSVY